MDGDRRQKQTIVQQGLLYLVESSRCGSFKNQLFKIDAKNCTRWHPPPPGYLRLDTDGSASPYGLAACGGLVRDANGNWVVGFQRRVDIAYSTAAELMGILTGLRLCKQFDYHKVHAYTDSLEALNLVMRDGGNHHPFAEEIGEIRELIFSDWDIELHYAPRETIKCADYLATDAQQLLGGYVILPMMHPGCRQYMREDLPMVRMYNS